MKIDKKYEIDRVVDADCYEIKAATAYAYLNTERRELEACNGYSLVRVPVEPEPDDADGPVTAEALKTARKAGRNGTAVINSTNKLHPRPATPDYRCWDQLIPTARIGDPQTVSISLDARLLYDLARAMGRQTEACQDVVLTIQLGRHGQPLEGAPFLIQANPSAAYGLESDDDGRNLRAPYGILMPTRLAFKVAPPPSDPVVGRTASRRAK
jgi:hypothetical protein